MPKRIYIKAFSFKKSRLERSVIAISISAFFVLFMAQIGLSIPESRSEFTDIEVYEGLDLAGKLPEASFVLEADPLLSAGAVVLFNGTPYGEFSEGRCSISVLNRGLVEIDGRACLGDFSAYVLSADAKLSGVKQGDTFLIGRKMTILGRVEVRTNTE